MNDCFTHTDEMFGQRQISHGHFCFFLNTGLWGGIFFFQLLKKKAQKCICEGGKRQKLSNSFPWRDMKKKTESIVERIHFSHHWASCILLLVH